MGRTEPGRPGFSTVGLGPQATWAEAQPHQSPRSQAHQSTGATGAKRIPARPAAAEHPAPAPEKPPSAATPPRRPRPPWHLGPPTPTCRRKEPPLHPAQGRPPASSTATAARGPPATPSPARPRQRSAAAAPSWRQPRNQQGLAEPAASTSPPSPPAPPSRRQPRRPRPPSAGPGPSPRPPPPAGARANPPWPPATHRAPTCAGVHLIATRIASPMHAFINRSLQQ
jgi:hypothetical protein